MFSFQLNFCLFIFLLLVCRTSSLDTYVAAVYEHAVILPPFTETPVTSEEALMQMNKNIDILEKAVRAAAQKGAHIIVTPEDGIYGFNFKRETIFPYLEDIPDPQVNWIPCTDPQRFGQAPVQERLSCMAKNNHIYVVANMGDKKSCNTNDPRCPSNSYYQYNTAIVFDSDGKLIARYHKYNLFMSEEQFNRPVEPELVTFDSPFGKFGIFICFDILFHDPAVALVSRLNVDTILFPTAWMNVLPHLTAIEFHSAWAMGMGVNFLAANLHNTSMRMTGSGIYAPDKPIDYYYNMDTEDGRLMISELNSHPRLSPSYTAVNWNSYASSINNLSLTADVFSGFIFFDKYSFTALADAEGNLSVCQEDLCCLLSYRMVEKRQDEIFVLGVFNGLHVIEGKYYLQVCTLVKCKSTNLTTCGEPTENSLTTFEEFSLSGTFSTNYVFPEVLLSGIHLAPADFQVLSDGRLISKSSISIKPVLAITLFGRWYEKDPEQQLMLQGSID
ncbi:pantetheinase [Microcaecilia unicolor]|uniref:Pantetheinase n=1 Tax=Microcaecilia unicolor TaxID=1415580 RepID=A0A6P7XP65_9AMPH|nr:pantetheinase [Microcaecilia unicolor]